MAPHTPSIEQEIPAESIISTLFSFNHPGWELRGFRSAVPKKSRDSLVSTEHSFIFQVDLHDVFFFFSHFVDSLQTAQQQQQQWPARPKRSSASSAANPLNLSTGSLFQGACFLLVISGERLGIVGINSGLTYPPCFLCGGKKEGEE